MRILLLLLLTSYTIVAQDPDPLGALRYEEPRRSDFIYPIVYSPDRKMVLASWDNIFKVYRAATGEEIVSQKGHSSSIWSLAFCPDGQKIVSVSDDKTVIIWISKQV